MPLENGRTTVLSNREFWGTETYITISGGGGQVQSLEYDARGRLAMIERGIGLLTFGSLVLIRASHLLFESRRRYIRDSAALQRDQVLLSSIDFARLPEQRQSLVLNSASGEGRESVTVDGFNQLHNFSIFPALLGREVSPADAGNFPHPWYWEIRSMEIF